MSIQRMAPGPKSAFSSINNFIQFQRTPQVYLQKLLATYGDIVHVPFGLFNFYVMNHPDFVHEVLIEKAEHFHKHERQRQIWTRVSGNSILNSEGGFWRRQRKMIQPSFHAKAIERYAQTMIDYSVDHVAGWRDGGQYDLANEMMSLTLRIVTKTLFDSDVDAVAERINYLFTNIQAITNRQTFALAFAPAWVPTPDNLRFWRLFSELDGIIAKFIDQRSESKESGHDLLSMLISATDEDDHTGMGRRQVRDEAINLFLGGHESTAAALMWTWYRLATHPEVDAKVAEELERVLHGRIPTFQDLRQLKYLDMVFKEVLRVHPPTWGIVRQAIADVNILGYRIPKGSSVLVAPYLLHHDTRYFDDPLAFRPERFEANQEKQQVRYSYIPFGAGPRICIGQPFAIMESLIILATFRQKFHVELVPDQRIELAALRSPRPKFGIRAQIHAVTRTEQSAPDTGIV